jgi:hypothetical protein
MRLGLACATFLWKSLWNGWRREKASDRELRCKARNMVSQTPKALSSNQLGNSLGINMERLLKTLRVPVFEVLHISRFLTL